MLCECGCFTLVIFTKTGTHFDLSGLVCIVSCRGCPTARYFFLCRQEKVSKKKAAPLPLVSFGLGATLVRLRNSDFQSSDSPRRFTQLMLKPQARQKGKSQNNVAQCLSVISSYACWWIESSWASWSKGKSRKITFCTILIIFNYCNSWVVWEQ